MKKKKLEETSQETGRNQSKKLEETGQETGRNHSKTRINLSKMEETFLQQVETVLNHNKLFKCGENSQKTVQNLSKNEII